MYKISVAVLILLFALIPSAQGQTFTVLYNFSPGAWSWPNGGLVMDKAGNLFGTNTEGVYELRNSGSGWLLNPLHIFFEGGAEQGPSPGLTLTADGALYGATGAGGIGSCLDEQGCGRIFHLQPAPTACRTALCPWTSTLLYEFTDKPPDGYLPQGDLVFDGNGNIFGTTNRGSISLGTAFELTPSDGGWSETVLYLFQGGQEGAFPVSGVVLEQAGTVYGVAYGGGSSHCGEGCGTVWQLTHTESGWVETTIHTFQGTDGNNPAAALLMDQAGNLYGTTYFGGPYGGGTVFELTPSGGGWTFNVLADLTGGGIGKLAMDAAGNLYGLDGGGAYGHGSVFKLTPSGGSWIFSSVHDFTGASGGDRPQGDILLDAAGNLYGATYQGGGANHDCPNGCGLVWEITP